MQGHDQPVSSAHELESEPTPTPAPNVDVEVAPAEISLGFFGVLWYLFLGLLVLVVLIGVFLACNGRQWLRAMMRESQKPKHDGYQKVEIDTEA